MWWLLLGTAFAAAPGSTFVQWFDAAGLIHTSSTSNPFPVNATVNTTNPTVGASVPATANYVAGNKSGNLTGLLIGQQTMANSLGVTLASDQSAISISETANANSTLSSRQSVNGTESNVQAPANAVGFIVECESGNQDNLRWGLSNATSAILSTTLGMLCEPGRDSGFVPAGAGNYVHMIAVTTNSSDFIDIQWVLSK